LAYLKLRSGKHAAIWRDEFGQRHQEGNFDTAENAKAFAILKTNQAATNRAKLRAGTPADQLLTVSDAIDLYLSGKHIRESTRKTQTATFAAMRRQLGNLQLHSITPQLLSTYVTARALSTAPTTLAFEKRMIKCLFATLEHGQILARNPAVNIKGTTSQTTTARALTRDEELQVITMATPRTLPRFLLAIDAGLRLREITGLRYNHLDIPHQIIQVWSTKVQRTRRLVMTNRLTYAMQDHITRITAAVGQISHDTRLFALKRPDSFLWEFRAKLGWHFRFHDLRHTCSTRLRQAGADEMLIAAVLGHSWRNTTDLYTVTHVTTDDMRPHFERMEALAIAHANAKLSEPIPDFAREEANER
jgi:integrase